jgi:excisionase family DNA binding protein
MSHLGPLVFREISMAAMPEGEVFTVRQVADFLQVTTVTVRAMIRDGQLQAIRVRNVWRITREQLAHFLEKRGSLPPPSGRC